MLQCWKNVPKERPSFTALRETFEALLSESEGYIDFDEIREDSIYYMIPSFNSQNNEEYSISKERKDDEEDGAVSS